MAEVNDLRIGKWFNLQCRRTVAGHVRIQEKLIRGKRPRTACSGLRYTIEIGIGAGIIYFKGEVLTAGIVDGGVGDLCIAYVFGNLYRGQLPGAAGE